MNKTYYQVLKEAAGVLKAAGIEEADLNAWYLLAEVFGIDRTFYLLNQQKEVPEQQYCDYQELIQKRASRIPLQHLTGIQEFMGLSFLVNPFVLIPRQDTELLVEMILSEHQERKVRILDLCTGSGCIAVSLKQLGGYDYVAASDLSQKALETAIRNGQMNHCQIDFRQGDLLAPFEAERFDIIVSNPPYIPTAVIAGLEPEVRDFEPGEALDGTADGLHFYRRIAKESKVHLSRPGYLYLEIGHDQLEAVEQILGAEGFTGIEGHKDLAGHDRMVKAVFL